MQPNQMLHTDEISRLQRRFTHAVGRRAFTFRCDASHKVTAYAHFFDLRHLCENAAGTEKLLQPTQPVAAVHWCHSRPQGKASECSWKLMRIVCKEHKHKARSSGRTAAAAARTPCIHRLGPACRHCLRGPK